jgi:hypothetical protein
VVIHDLGDPASSRQAPKVEHHHREQFTQEVLRALDVARSAIQMLHLQLLSTKKDWRSKKMALLDR